MGRQARFTEERILDAALETVAREGVAGATVAAIAARLGAPVGSIYHRFPSRDLLLARLWIRCVQRFQEGFLDALAAGDLERAAVHTPRWCREHLAEARVLLLHRPADLVARWPAELGEELAALDARTAGALTAAAGGAPELPATPGLPGPSGLPDPFVPSDPSVPSGRERLVFALVDVPYGAVRRHLAAGQAPPPLVDALVLRTCRAVLSP
ncbi:TetR/AcrR family transcriptional regulator [Streptosporangium sp. NPDC023615]|uniref:TetR/AcrR family transcriptional regulator n=1 Tax=Streptosporangium sp. NPDC023615 TaxID=3154794 RepID=UPI003439D8EE